MQYLDKNFENKNWPWIELMIPKIREDILFPKITIVTPSFNQGIFLEETILSVLNQNYPNLEYIIIDGGSSDNSINIIKKYEKHLTYWISEKDNGQSDAINKGIIMATGDIFNWLNSDDFLSPRALFIVAEQFKNTKISVVCGKTYHYGNGDPYISAPSTYFDYQNEKAFVPRINQPATFFKMDIIKELGPLNNNLHYCMDLEWWVKYLFLHGHQHISFREDVLVNFREHKMSKTMSQSFKFTEDKCLLLISILSKKRGIKNSFGDHIFDIDFNNYSIEFLEKMSAHELLMGVIVFYGRREFKKIKIILNYLNVKYLSEAELKKLNVIKFRIKYIPVFILKLI